jgi:hypothetical protein
MHLSVFAKTCNLKFLRKSSNISIFEKMLTKINLLCMCSWKLSQIFLQLLQKKHILQAAMPIWTCLTPMFAKTFVKTNSLAKSVTNVFIYIIKHLLIAQHYHAVYSTIIRETFFCRFVLLIITGMACIVKWTLKCVNFSIISKNVPFRPMTVQVPNSALVEDENG